MADRRSLTFGLIGCGGIMNWHIRNLLKIPGVTIGALSDPAAGNLDRAKREFPDLRPASTYAGHRELLKRSILDAVVIASPHSMHYDHVMDALNAGCHVLVEKPFVATVAQGRRAIALARRRKKVLMVSYQRHFEPRFRYLRRLLQGGRIGRIQTMASALGQGWLDGTRGSWRQDPKLSCGGQLNDSGSHILDISLWMTGLKPVEVYAHLNNCGSRVDINSAVAVRMNNGAVWTISIGGNTPGFWEHHTIAGDRGAVMLGPDGKLTVIADGARSTVEPTGRYHDQDAGFVKAIRGETPNEVPGEFGLIVTALTQGAFRAARERRPVRISL